ncbi:type I-F CRISPR-associated protein Csy1 [Azorhizophilus paspali]|uniref:type I-F CRISPR-associated protein Csy1 n=1 Tax=Azorhizophilus paspali TaxID=69963 RepID=UPI0036397F4F
MNEVTGSEPRSNRFRTTIATFIEARREAKLKGKDDDAGTASKYEYATWLADAARRVGQIQAVTHVLKATHPDARGSSLHIDPVMLPQHRDIGSHLLGEDYAEDVVGNAAALDVFKFLKLDVDGKRLIDWMQAGDADLMAALSPDSTLAKTWMEAFASLVRKDAEPTTHPMAKQVYWLVGEDPWTTANTTCCNRCSPVRWPMPCMQTSRTRASARATSRRGRLSGTSSPPMCRTAIIAT